MGEAGMRVVERVLPDLRKEHGIDVTIAQSENVSDGKGLTVNDFHRLQQMGVDVCTAGNWTMHREELHPLLNDPKVPVVRPANYPEGTPGLGYKYVDTPAGKILVISLLGQILGRDSAKAVDNPL